MCADKQRILEEIRQRAEENDGVPLGWMKFKRVTGMRLFEWYGKYWLRWGDATAEAGLKPNTMSQPYSLECLFESLVKCIRELGRYPVVADLLFRSRNEPGFPSPTAYKRLGNRPDIIRKLVDYCSTRPKEDEHSGYDDVLQICKPLLEEIAVEPKKVDPSKPESKPKVRWGYVYLFESVGLYKIGYSYNVIRRGQELSWLLPNKGVLIHAIRTDDPRGIEDYWHSRFAGKRAHAEWFRLSDSDVATFSAWKGM